MKLILSISFYLLACLSLDAQTVTTQDSVVADTITVADSCETEKNNHVVEKSFDYAFQSSDWKIGPNPTTDVIYIYGIHEYIEAVEVYSITGEFLVFLEKEQAADAIDLSHYPGGIYFVRITDINGVGKTYKVLKR